jgi:sugar lactone lactonase YvrE
MDADELMSRVDFRKSADQDARETWTLRRLAPFQLVFRRARTEGGADVGLYFSWRRVLAGAAVAVVAGVFATGALGVSGSDTIITLAGGGTGKTLGDGGPATSARLSFPNAVAVDGKGNVYIADTRNGRVRKVTPGGAITTIAGPGPATGDIGDGGPATSARLSVVTGVAVDGRGNVYIACQYFNRVRKVTPDGKITTFAGGGQSIADGVPATSALVANPWALAVDAQGNVYIAEDHRVRKVDAAGTITTIAGTTRRGFSGDGGPATSARLFWPRGLALDGQGNLYIADHTNNRVRKVDANGTITTVAGTGTPGFSGDGGPATSAQLSRTSGVPMGLAVDADGSLYIADTGNNRIRKVSTDGKITTVAGTGVQLFGGDGGPASSAKLNWPAGLALDRRGSLYIADYGNARVRKTGEVAGGSALDATVGGASSQRLLAEGGITVTAGCNQPCSLSATGSVTIAGTHYVFGLTRASAGLAAGKRTLKLGCTSAQLKRFRKLFKPGRRAQAVITVKATDKTGHTTTSKRMVVVR